MKLVSSKLSGPPVSVVHSAGDTGSDMPGIPHWCLDLSSILHIHTESSLLHWAISLVPASILFCPTVWGHIVHWGREGMLSGEAHHCDNETVRENVCLHLHGSGDREGQEAMPSWKFQGLTLMTCFFSVVSFPKYSRSFQTPSQLGPKCSNTGGRHLPPNYHAIH